MKNLPIQWRSVSPSSPANKISEVIALWRKLINEYSKKELAFEIDVLSALSRLASLVHTATGDQYLAGIWRCDLPAALQWVPQDLDWRSTTYLAPTWSWAACKKSCPIIYPFPSTTQSKVKILDAGITLDGDNPFGRVSDGFLKLKGLVQRGTFKRLSPDSQELQICLQHNETQVRSSHLYEQYDGEVAALPPVWCLQLCVRVRSLEMFPMQIDDSHLYGILFLEEDRRDGTFRRLAYEICGMTDADWHGAVEKIIVIK